MKGRGGHYAHLLAAGALIVCGVGPQAARAQTQVQMPAAAMPEDEFLPRYDRDSQKPVPVPSGPAAPGPQTEAQNPEAFPAEPVFAPVKGVLFEWPKDLRPRIESLVHGITMDMPPEYDHFGYPIRRYMVSVGNLKVLASSQGLKGQLINIDNALMVLGQWHNDMNMRLAQAARQMEAEHADPTLRSLYTYNEAAVNAFMMEAGHWIKSNKAVLDFLLSIGPSAYAVEGSKFSFRRSEDLEKFIALYETREKALVRMKAYTPFKLMVY